MMRPSPANNDENASPIVRKGEYQQERAKRRSVAKDFQPSVIITGAALPRTDNRSTLASHPEFTEKVVRQAVTHLALFWPLNPAGLALCCCRYPGLRFCAP